VTDADKTACDYCEYVREEQLLLDAHDYLEEALLFFDFAKNHGKYWTYLVDSKRKRFLLDYVNGHERFGILLTVYIKEFNTIGYAIGGLKADAEMFRNGRKQLECKCDTDHSSAE